MPHAFHTPAQLGELLDDASLTLEDLARACCARPGMGERACRRRGCSNHPAQQPRRRVRHLAFQQRHPGARTARSPAGSAFGAIPYLAAMTTDLMEEVARLRRRLRHLEEGAATAHGGR